MIEEDLASLFRRIECRVGSNAINWQECGPAICVGALQVVLSTLQSTETAKPGTVESLWSQVELLRAVVQELGKKSGIDLELTYR